MAANPGSNPIVEALEQMQRNLDRTAQRFANAMRGQRGRLANRALDSLRRVPGGPVYPIRWTSDKQRRAFFASKGFGRGIPARRGSPPAVTEGWETLFIPTEDGGILALVNPEEHVDYVQGFNAQGFHKDTGWVQLGDVMGDFFRDAEDAAVQVYFGAETDPLEGV